MAQYPSTAGTDANLYVAVNNKTTTLTSGIDAVVTSIPVASTTGFPSAGFVTVDLEIIAYTSVDATHFLGATRAADGSTATAHSTNAQVSHNIVAAHHNALKDEIKAVETDLVSAQQGAGSVAANIALKAVDSTVVHVTGTESIAGAKTFTDPITQNDTTNQLVLGVTRTVTVNAPTPASASRTVTIPDQGTDYSVVATEGTQTINGAKTFTDPITQNDTTNQLVLGVTRTVTISAPTPASASRIVTLPDQGTDYSVVATEGAQTINGAKTFADPITQNDITNQLVLGTTRTVTISAPTPASTSRVITLPDQGADYSVVATAGTQTISGTKTFDGQLIGKGTTTNDNAASGYIGEYISSVVSAANFSSTGTYGDLTSISLTAGDWDVSVNFAFQRNTASWSDFEIGISTTAGNSGTGLVAADNRADFINSAGITNINFVSAVIPSYRMSLSATTTVYLKYVATYTVAAPSGLGRLSARRVR